jgi:hypothetical protein
MRLVAVPGVANIVKHAAFSSHQRESRGDAFNALLIRVYARLTSL